MANIKSTRKRPEKPFREFPLFAHNNGSWCRKIRGRIYSFGSWNDPTAALEKHAREYPYLKAGIPVPDRFDGYSVSDLVNKFLLKKEAERDAGVISARWYDDLYNAGLLIFKHINRNRPVESLGPTDFEGLRLAVVSKHSPTIARGLISRVRSIFNYGIEARLIDKPVFFGKDFKPPSKAAVRKHRAKGPKKLWKPEQIQSLLKHANPVMSAMILLGINAGVNNSDLVNMPTKVIDLRSRWMDYPRAKTGVSRRVKLWPETIAAIKAWLAVRPEPYRETDAELLFVTKMKNRWDGHGIGHEFTKVCTAAGIETGSFAWFRKTVQTIGENSGDLIAVKAIMGHVDESISDKYREEIDDDRIIRVVDTLHVWLYPKPKPKPRKARKAEGGAQ